LEEEEEKEALEEENEANSSNFRKVRKLISYKYGKSSKGEEWPVSQEEEGPFKKGGLYLLLNRCVHDTLCSSVYWWLWNPQWVTRALVGLVRMIGWFLSISAVRALFKARSLASLVVVKPIEPDFEHYYLSLILLCLVVIVGGG